MSDAPITAADERGRQFKAKKLRKALRTADVDGASSMELRTLGFVFASAELDPNEFIKTSGLSDPDRKVLKEKSDALRSAVETFSDISENGQQDDHNDEVPGWDTICGLYEQDRKSKARLAAARRITEELGVATHETSGRIYVYDHEEKIHAQRGEQAIERTLIDKLGPRHSRHEQKEIKAKVKALTYRSEFGSSEVVPVANGDLEVSSMKLKEATPQRAFLSRSPAAWKPSAECPIFETYLSEVVPDEKQRQTLQEYAGYGLMHWALPFHKSLFIVGPTASGKSTYLHTVRKLYGKVSSVSPQQLVNGRFGAIELEGAWANIRADISSALLKDIGLFKEIVGGDPIHVERKYEQGYQMEPTAKHLYSANRLPDIEIDDDAFFRRILLVSFPTTVPKDQRDPSLPNRLEQELDGILRWAIEGLSRVLAQEGFTHDLTPNETRRRWEEHSSSIGRFKASALKVTGDSSDVAVKEDVFSAYTAFCEDQGLSTETQQELTRTLKRDPYVTDAHRTPPGWSKQTRCYVGVQLRDGWHPRTDDEPF